jgi:DNA primase
LIPSDTISRIRERVDIVEVIGEFVQLKRAGTNFKGLCPFHQEKTASFNVSQARQIFHCFGCHEGGDGFAFLIKYEGRTFADAARTLAQRAGIEIEERDVRPADVEERQRRQHERERLLQVMEAVARFYQDVLRSPDGQVARTYLESRGIERAVADEFTLGFAPTGWDILRSHLRELEVSPIEAEKLGLIAARKGGGGYYDRFRERLIFPVHDAVGRVIALAGRVLPGAPPDAPKYINSPESPLYSKTRTLYGLHLAREAMRQGQAPVLVEGNVDVISLHAHGIRSTVAPMGTALTTEQVGLLRRFAGVEASIVLVFDGDSAGRQAVLKAQPSLAEGGLGGRVVLLPNGEDPDSFVRRRGGEALTTLIDGALGLVEHLIAETASATGNDERAKARAIRSLSGVLSTVRDPLERDLYRKRVATSFGVADELVFRYLRGTEPKKQKQEKEAAAISDAPQNLKKAELALAGALLDYPELIYEVPGGSTMVQEQHLKWLLKQLPGVVEGGLELERLIDIAPNERFAQWIGARLVEPEYRDVGKALQAIRDSLAKMRELGETEEGRRLLDDVSEAQLEGDADRAGHLAQEKLQRKRAAVLERSGASRR